MNKDLEYILKFDENKLFNTKLDDENTNKVKAREEIKQVKIQYKNKQAERYTVSDLARALDFCGVKYTNTPHQALGIMIKKALKGSEYLWLLEYTANELRKVENEKNN